MAGLVLGHIRREWLCRFWIWPPGGRVYLVTQTLNWPFWPFRLSTFASSQFCSRFTVHSFAHSFPLSLGAIHKACLTSRGGIFSTNGGGNKLNIICSLTENLDEFKNQHIEICFEIKQVCTSISNICFDIRWFFCKILCLYDAAISHIFLFCKNFYPFPDEYHFPKDCYNFDEI